MSETRLTKKYIGLDQVGSAQLEIENNQSIRAKDSSGVSQDLMKYSSSDEFLMLKAPVLPGDATSALQAIPKQQLDAGLDLKVSKAGDTMSGTLNFDDTFGGTGYIDGYAVAGSYVDGSISQTWSLSGATGLSLADGQKSVALNVDSGLTVTNGSMQVNQGFKLEKSFEEFARYKLSGIDINTLGDAASLTVNGADFSNAYGSATYGAAAMVININTSLFAYNLNGSGRAALVDNLNDMQPIMPVADYELVVKKYVDDGLALKSDITSVMLLDGTQPMEANMDLGSFQITNLADPSANQDAATKKYVDDGLAPKADSADVMLLDGSQAMAANMDLGSFQITNLADPSANQDAATKKYVDDGLAPKADSADVMLLDGSQAMAADMDLGTHKIINVVDPVSAQDAATKKYVDDGLALKPDTTTVMLLDGSQSMEADLSMGDATTQYKITNLAAGTEPTDAVTVGQASAALDEKANLNLDNLTATAIPSGVNLVSMRQGPLNTGVFAVGTAQQSSAVSGSVVVTSGTGTGSFATGLSILTTGVNSGTGASGNAVVSSGAISNAASSAVTGNAHIFTGNNAGSGASGDIVFQTGTVVSGVRGKVSIGARIVEINSQLDMQSNKIVDLADPTDAQDAATKAYVDAQIAAGTDFEVQKVVLSSTDITNQYIDLAYLAAQGSIVASSSRVNLIIVLGADSDADFQQDNSGSVTRLIFQGPAATGGVSELEAGQVIYFNYVKA